MIGFRKPVLIALIGAALVLSPTTGQADWTFRVTELTSTGTAEESFTQTFIGNPSDNGGSNTFTMTHSLTDFTVTVVTNTADTGPGFSAHSTTISLSYRAGAVQGALSDRLLVEVIGDHYVNPTQPGPALITSNGSPSNSGLSIASVTMTSGVINGNHSLSGTAGTILGGQLGMTTGTGSMGLNSSGILVPNPAESIAPFNIANPYSFYQTYLFAQATDAKNRNGAFVQSSGTLSAGSQVDAVPSPVPAGILLLLSGLPALGFYGLWMRMRQRFQMA